MKKMTTTTIMFAAVTLAAQNAPRTTPQQPTAAQPAQRQANAPQTPAPGTIPSDAIPVIPGVNVIPKGVKGAERIAREVRHELAMLPHYTLFDDLRFRVNGSTVELLGDVINSSLKTDAEKAIRDIEGVEQVVNHINILPPSPMDDRIRQQVARAVFGTDGLSRYAWEASPSIHIIVKSARLRLVGVVDSETDKNMAGIAANSVPGIFAVDNQLFVAGK